jgi:hypothetical protein
MRRLSLACRRVTFTRFDSARRAHEHGGTRECGPPESEVAIVNRYYFHLVDNYDVIPDEIGIQVTDLKEVYIEAMKAIYEFRQEHSATAVEWEAWRIEVTDAWGNIALTLPLSEFGFHCIEPAGRERVLS